MYNFTDKKEQKGYFNEIIILDERMEIYNYSLSNNLDDIKIAIYERTGYNVNLNNATWDLNPRLSISMKDLMNKHQKIFSMTTGINTVSKSKFVVVNMHAGDLWFIAGYREVEGNLFSWHEINILKIILELEKNINHIKMIKYERKRTLRSGSKSLKKEDQV